MKTALIIGATGLVGSHLLNRMLHDARFEKVIVLTRRSTKHAHIKIEEYLIDFDKPEDYRQLVKGDVLFSTLGTTLKKAGSKEAQYTIDHNYQYQVASAAAKNGVPHYVLVSSANASLNSLFFYSRMKAELERDVQKLSFKKISILRPGILKGEREETRIGETIGVTIAGWLHKIPGLAGLKPIEGDVVAQAMVQAVFQQEEAFKIYQPGAVFDLAAMK